MKPKVPTITRKKHVLDACEKAMGRVASQAAILLMGKHKVGYRYEKDSGDRVFVKNVGSMTFTGTKLSIKKYFRHSLHPGGIKEESLSSLFRNDPVRLFRLTVFRMLPVNKLRAQRMKRLRIER